MEEQAGDAWDSGEVLCDGVLVGVWWGVGLGVSDADDWSVAWFGEFAAEGVGVGCVFESSGHDRGVGCWLFCLWVFGVRGC